MDLNNTSNKMPVGVIGAGSFGTAISNLLAENNNVITYVRRQEVADAINKNRFHKNQKLKPNIIATTNIEEVAKNCSLIFPVIPSSAFKTMLKSLSKHLTPAHMLIHATKGFHVEKQLKPGVKLKKEEILTMSELMMRETGVVRIGCLSGPNLSKEILEGQPAGTVIASEFDEVIKEGKKALNSKLFRVYGSNEIIGIELAGVLKNYIAIASGILSGLGYGNNAKAMLITRGMAEMIYIAKALGASTEKAFLGIAGIGDLIATCSSELSRNFRVGYYLTQGEKLEEIVEKLGEVAEGVKTVQIIKGLEEYGFRAPIAQTMYKILFENISIKDAASYLMTRPAQNDVDFVSYPYRP